MEEVEEVEEVRRTQRRFREFSVLALSTLFLIAGLQSASIKIFVSFLLPMAAAICNGVSPFFDIEEDQDDGQNGEQDEGRGWRTECGRERRRERTK